ncbi:MAG: tetratricopeptide repeat protein [Bacteroidota bacterium]
MKAFISGLLLFLVAQSTVFGQQSEAYNSEITTYQRALNLYQKAQYPAAKRLFNEVGKTTKKEQLKANSTYYAASSSLKLEEANADLLMEEFVRNYPTSNKRNMAFFEVAEFYFNKSDYKKALRWYAQIDAYDLAREHKPAYNFHYAYVLFKSGKEKKAANYFKRVQKHPEYSDQANYYLGYLAYEGDDYESAEDYFEDIDEAAESSPEMSYIKSDMSFKAGKFEEAIEAAEQKMPRANYREKSELNKIIGESYFNLKEYEKAIPYLKEYEGERGRWYNTDYYQLGYAYFNTGDFESAISEFNRIIDGDDDVAQNAYYHLAQSYLKMDKKSEALNAFKNASEMEFNEEIQQDAFLNYAKLSYEIGNSYQSVPEVLIAYMEKYPESIEAEEIGELLIDAYISTKNYEQALDLLEGSRDFEDKKIYQRVAFYYAVDFFNEKKYDQAKHYFTQSLSNRIDKTYTAKATYWKAEVDYLSGNFKEAIVGYKEFEGMAAAKNTDEFEHVYYNLAYAYFKHKDYASARDNYEKYLKNANQRAKIYDAHVRLGDAHFALGKFWPAMESYNNAIEMQSHRGDYAFYQKAISYGFVDRNSRKIEELENFLKRYPNSLYKDNALYELGNTYVSENQETKGVQSYQRILDEMPKSRLVPRALSKQGLLYYNTNQNEKALDKLKRLANNYPDSEQAAQAVETVRMIYIDMGRPEAYAAWVEGLDFVEVADADIDNATFESAENPFLEGKNEKAIKGFKNYLKEFPNGIHALKANFYLAQLLYNKGEKEESISHYEYVMNASKSEFTEQALSRLSQVHLEKEDYKAAIPVLENLERVAEYQQNIVFAKSNLMKSYYRTEDYENTMLYAEQVLEMSGVEDKAKSDAQLFTARAALVKGNESKARAAYKEVAENSSSGELVAEALYHEAKFLHDDGAYEKSTQIVQKIAKEYSRYREFASKALIIMAKNFNELDDAFQANYILESVIKSSTKYPNVIQEAEAELQKIKKEQSKTNASIDETKNKDSTDEILKESNVKED